MLDGRGVDGAIRQGHAENTGRSLFWILIVADGYRQERGFQLKIQGKSFGAHLRLVMPFFWFIAGVWLLRLSLPMFSPPGWVVSVLSIHVAVSISVLVVVVLIFSRQFGGYANVVFSTFLLVAWGELLVSAAILFAVLTGTENIFIFPEFSLEADPYHIKHITGHLTFSLGGGTLVGSGMGCLLLFLLRTLVPTGSQTSEEGPAG